MTEQKGTVIQFSRLDTAASKAELIAHIQSDHSQVPPISKRVTKDTLITLHRLIHFGIGR